MLQHSLAKEDGILDYEIAIEEVESIVKSLKNGKSCGADEISPEHLKYGGPALICWLKRLFNAMVMLEYIPPSLCHGLIIPVYEGKGRDPFNPNGYCGITLTSVIAKIFETILLRRMLPILHKSNFPHISQTAYLSGRSCADALFVTNETPHSFMRNGDSPYLCLYDLEKAFDSIEYVHLLKHLFQLGVNGKTWRLISFGIYIHLPLSALKALFQTPFKFIVVLSRALICLPFCLPL